MGSISGSLGTLDVQTIVSQLMWAERAPVRSLQSRISSYQTKIEAYSKLSSHLSDLLSTARNLANDDAFAAKAASSSNETVLRASASAGATEGTYLIGVKRLALHDNFVSDTRFSTANEAIGTGTFTLTVGSSSTVVTIDDTNNTLDGLRRAVNNANLGVTAAVIYDGSGYRLTITSKESGSTSAISISENTLTLSDGVTPLTFSRTHSISDASELDASLVINGLSLTSSSNQVENAVPGVSLNLLSVSDSTVTLTVRNDIETVRGNVESFVESYNTVYRYLNSQFQYNAASGKAGPLSGEFIVRDIQRQLASVVTGAVPTGGSLTTLASIGVKLQNDGTLSIDTTRLDKALKEHFEELVSLFTAQAEATHSLITPISVGSSTQTGTYRIDITAVPEPATVTAPNAITGTLGVDETLTITMGGKTSVVELAGGMTLADIVDVVNAQLGTDGLALTASQSGDRLVFTSKRNGDSISFTVVSNIDGGGTGIGTAGLSDSGASVAGNFTNSLTSEVYAATGSGDILRGTEGAAKDLWIRFGGGSTGTYGTVTVTVGFAERLARLTERFTDSLEGPIHHAVKGFENTIKSLQDSVSAMEERLASRERYLTDQFSRANQALQQLSYLQSTLSQQLTALYALL
jgi:flagellar hook-associated protein 2